MAKKKKTALDSYLKDHRGVKPENMPGLVSYLMNISDEDRQRHKDELLGMMKAQRDALANRRKSK